VHVAGKVEETPKRITGDQAQQHCLHNLKHPLPLSFSLSLSLCVCAEILPTAFAMWFGDPNPLERKSKVQLTANEPLDPSQKPRTQLALSLSLFPFVALQTVPR
jgi:hypothetical protein